MSEDAKYVIVVFKAGQHVSAHLGQGAVCPAPTDSLLKVHWCDPDNITFYNRNEIVFYQHSLGYDAFEEVLPSLQRLIADA